MTRTTIMINEILLERLKVAVDVSSTNMGEYIEKALVNQIEKDFFDFELRDQIEEGRNKNG